MRKIFSILLVFALVLGSFSMAFAFEDVDADNLTLKEATEALNNLKITQGYDDGSFKPEKAVTRAEMAKMLIVARGLGGLAIEMAANQTTVTGTVVTTPVSLDDCQNHWAKGYISLASDLGIINGRGNGIFDPNATVTYQEAAVMMLRALGYTNESINGGSSTAYNAAAYKTKAKDLGLRVEIENEDVKAGANRGDIAIMINDGLSQQTVVTNLNGIAVPTGNTLLQEHDETTEILEKYGVAIKDIDITSETIAQYSEVDLTLYLNQNIRVMVKSDGQIISVIKVNHAIENEAATTVTPAAVTTPDAVAVPVEKTTKKKKSHSSTPVIADVQHPGLYLITGYNEADGVTTPATISLYGLDMTTAAGITVNTDATYTLTTTLGAILHDSPVSINSDMIVPKMSNGSRVPAIVTNYVTRNDLLTSLEITELEEVTVSRSAIQTSSAESIEFYCVYDYAGLQFDTSTIENVSTVEGGETCYVTMIDNLEDGEPERLYTMVMILHGIFI